MKRWVAAILVALGLSAFGASAKAATVDFVAKGEVILALAIGGSTPLDSGDAVEFHLTYETLGSDTDGDPAQGAYASLTRFDVTFQGNTYALPFVGASAAVSNGVTDILKFSYAGGPVDFISTADLTFTDATGAAFGDDSLPGLLAFQSLSGRFGLLLFPPGSLPVLIDGLITSVTAVSPVATTPIPAALPLLLSALGGLGFAGWRRRRAAA